MRSLFGVPAGLLLLAAGGCSIFREVSEARRDSLETSNRKTSLDWKIDSTYSTAQVFTYTDSSGALFDVEIMPLGAFTLSSQGGFAGSASRIRIRGKSQNAIRSSDSSSRQQQVQSTGSRKEHTKARTEKLEKQTVKKGDKSLWRVIALMSISSVVLFIIFRLIRQGANFTIQKN